MKKNKFKVLKNKCLIKNKKILVIIYKKYKKLNNLAYFLIYSIFKCQTLIKIVINNNKKHLVYLVIYLIKIILMIKKSLIYLDNYFQIMKKVNNLKYNKINFYLKLYLIIIKLVK